MDQNSQACIAPGKEKSFQKHSGYATLKYYDIGWKLQVTKLPFAT